ncbi:hypothetical protein [Amycolatopsis sp. NPDC054798]
MSAITWSPPVMPVQRKPRCGLVPEGPVRVAAEDGMARRAITLPGTHESVPVFATRAAAGDDP